MGVAQELKEVSSCQHGRKKCWIQKGSGISLNTGFGKSNVRQERDSSGILGRDLVVRGDI